MVISNQSAPQTDSLIDSEYDFKMENNKIRGKTSKDKMKLHDAKVNLNLFYRFSQGLQRRALRHLPKRKSFLPFRSIAYLIGYFLAKPTKRKLFRVWNFFYPETYRKYFSKWAIRLSASLIEFFFDVTFMMPGRTNENLNKDLSWEGLENVQEALKQGKGLIVTGLHIGQFIQPGRILLATKYDYNGRQRPIFLGILSSAENEFLVREQAKTYPNLDVIITDNFSNLKQGIENHLKKNHVVFVIQDFCHQNQLRVPFIHGMKKYDFLMPCPQLSSHFHFKMGAPVIYCINIPDGDLSRTHTIFSKPVDLYRDPQTEPDERMRKELIRFQNNEMEEYERFGLLSTEINRALNPYILQFPFFWEEVYPFWKRSSYIIDLSNQKYIGDALHLISERMIAFLKNSFEPGRQTRELVAKFEELKNLSKQVKQTEISKKDLIKEHDFGRMNTSQMLKELKKLIGSLIEPLNEQEKRLIMEGFPII
jgi:lauroyl/myristoyl acyltransferase